MHIYNYIGYCGSLYFLMCCYMLDIGQYLELKVAQKGTGGHLCHHHHNPSQDTTAL